MFRSSKEQFSLIYLNIKCNKGNIWYWSTSVNGISNKTFSISNIYLRNRQSYDMTRHDEGNFFHRTLFICCFHVFSRYRGSRIHSRFNRQTDVQWHPGVIVTHWWFDMCSPKTLEIIGKVYLCLSCTLWGILTYHKECFIHMVLTKDN